MTIQKAVRGAIAKTEISRHGNCRSFPGSFAAHLLENHYEIRTAQEFPGYKDARRTQIYTRLVKNKSIVKSSLDAT